MSTCETCGESVSIGEWPWCPHGLGNNLQAPMEPYTDHMLAGSPMEFRTISEKVRFMDRHGIVPRNEARPTSPSTAPAPADIRSAIQEAFREIGR